MNSVALFLAGDGALLALAVAAATIARRPFAPALVYGAALAISAALLIDALVHLLGRTPIGTMSLPLGLPWIGARFRLDALSAFFLIIVNLGGAAACLYGLGDGRLERSPERVLPFFPAFLAAMNIVLVANDALQLPHGVGVHVDRLVGARGGPSSRRGQRTRRLCLHRDGEFRHACAVAGLRLARGPDGQLRLRLHARGDACARRGRPRTRAGADRRGLEGRESCRSMSGCRSPTRRRQATSRRL